MESPVTLDRLAALLGLVLRAPLHVILGIAYLKTPNEHVQTE